MIGQSIKNYKILEKLNEGGMGAVYKGVDMVLNREVAIKVLRPELARQSTVIERFRSEALTLAKLNHPNIAMLHSFFEHGNELFMILEFVPGETLDKVLERRGALTCEEAIPIFCELLDSIDHAHEFGVIHRDIKPANIMLTEKGSLKVLDFGIARFQGRAKITRVGNILGTLEYMSPEQAKGEETDVRSDIYALGMTLYEILTCKTPFETENDFELIQKQISETPVQPRVINPNIPEEIEAAIIKAYAKEPNERFQTAGEFRQALINAYSHLSIDKNRITPSFPKKFTTGSLQFGLSQSTILEADFQGMSVDSPETPTVEIVRDSRFYVSTIDPFIEDNDGEKTDFSQDKLQKINSDSKLNKTSIKPSFLADLGKHYATTGIVGIFILLILLAVSPFIFFQNEKNQSFAEVEQNKLKAESKGNIETKTEVKEQKNDIITPTLGSPSAVKSQVPVESAQQKTASAFRKPSEATTKPRPTTKKKEPPVNETALLRRAEKVLTGN